MSRKKKKKIKKQKVDVKQLLTDFYATLPNTKGCMDNINKEGGCAGWCCRLQNPHALSCEFNNTWDYINENWSFEEILVIIEKALRNYLAGEVMKGCIFWDKDTKLCKIHKTRPYNCRVYGIIPEEEFKPRYDRLKEYYKDNILMVIKPQCELVSTSDGSIVTVADTDKWWRQMGKIEELSGVKYEDIVDEAGGTYMTLHDHLLVKILPPYVMDNLSKVRKFGRVDEKDNVIKVILDLLKKEEDKNDEKKNGETDTV